MNVREIADAFEQGPRDTKETAERRPPSLEISMDRLTSDLRLAAADRPDAEYLGPAPRLPIIHARTQ
jgi:hypothetical protein